MLFALICCAFQIFHLLKYDCWPRYLRAGGVAPTFNDRPDEATETPMTSESTFRVSLYFYLGQSQKAVTF